ncbi:MAG: family 20 glycosylhydrolase, partial [Lentisphaerae bacterium]|nr:family 20 glycosylhydrolase [Lentisphaerota bacterium]
PIAAPSPERLVAAPPFEAPRQARVVPAPQQCRWTGADPLTLAGRVRVASRGVATAAARDLLERVLSQDLGLAVERVEAPLEAIEQHAPALGILKRLIGRDLGRVVERLEGGAEVVILQGPLDLPKGLADWQREEAYALDVDARGIRIRAEGRRGALYGVQTLRQMLTRHDGRLHIPAAAILDWPVMRWRGWHVTGPDTSAAVPEAGRVIDLMAALKFNWIAIQIDSRLRYERHPALSRGPDAPTKDELRALVLQAQALGMEVIPMTQCWSHFNYFLEKEEFRHLAEIPHPPESAKRRFWNYCPRHPETHTMLFGMIEEQLECFPGATVFHVGLDEITFEPIGQCERCRGSTGGELLAEEIGRLHAFVTGKGLRLAMWGDQLLLSHNGKYFQTAEALPKVPRDVILFDWHYNAADEFASVPFFKNEGFEVVACGWYEPGNIAGLCAEAHRQGILGYGGTTWYSIAALRREVRLTTALPLSAEAMASAQPLDLAALPYRPAEVFQDLREPPDGRTASFLPVDLRGWANRRLSDRPERPGWLGLGPQHDLTALPTGRQWWCGVPFDILPGDGDQCLVLASSEDADGALPEEAWAIPVGTAADALVFLHTGSRPARFSRHIYDRAGINPGLIGRIVVRYDDGQTVEEELRWNVTLADWNSQLGSACGRSAWTGTTAGGALARVEALTWRNPHPEKAIASFDLVSARSTVRPVLLAVTARLPAP